MIADSPWVAVNRIDAFKEFCEREGYKVRLHPSVIHSGIQVRKDMHWMAVVWNKNTRRYTADRRLSLLVQSFAAEPTLSTQGEQSHD